MDIELENRVGSLKQVPQGLSWTGFFFTGFALMARGLVAKGLVFLVFFAVIEVLVVVARQAIFPGDWRKATAVALAYSLAAFTPGILCLFRINQWTLAHWVKRGYAPTPSMWRSPEPEDDVESRADQASRPWTAIKHAAGVAAAIFLFIKVTTAIYEGNQFVIDVVRTQPIVPGWTRQDVLERICRQPKWHEFRSKDGMRRVEFTGVMVDERVRLRFAVSVPDRTSGVQLAEIGSELVANERYPGVESNWAQALSSRLGSELAAQRSTYYLNPTQ